MTLYAKINIQIKGSRFCQRTVQLCLKTGSIGFMKKDFNSFKRFLKYPGLSATHVSLADNESVVCPFRIPAICIRKQERRSSLNRLLRFQLFK